MELTEASQTHRPSAAGHRPVGEPSVASSLEHLVAGSQGVITKRIDLALLEGQELLSRSIERGALVGTAMALAAAAWLAAVGACVLFVLPEAGLVIHLAAFALLNAAGAVGLVTLVMRRSRPQTRSRPDGDALSTAL